MGERRAGQCHAGLAAVAQREPDWVEVEAKGARAREEAEDDCNEARGQAISSAYLRAR